MSILRQNPRRVHASLENCERLVWNVSATVLGLVFAPYPFFLARQNPKLLKHWMAWREEKNLDCATVIVTALGMGKLHQNRIQTLTKAIFG